MKVAIIWLWQKPTYQRNFREAARLWKRPSSYVTYLWHMLFHSIACLLELIIADLLISYRMHISVAMKIPSPPNRLKISAVKTFPINLIIYVFISAQNITTLKNIQVGLPSNLQFSTTTMTAILGFVSIVAGAPSRLASQRRRKSR